MRTLRPLVPVLALAFAACASPFFASACAASHDDAASPGADSGADAARVDTTPADTTPPSFDVAEDVPPDTAPPPDPTTCDEAKTSKSYLGCDFWPTVTANRVWEVFDFAAIVANAGDVEAHITVTGPGGFTKEVHEDVRAHKEGTLLVILVDAADLERWIEADDRVAVLRGLHERGVFDLKR